MGSCVTPYPSSSLFTPGWVLWGYGGHVISGSVCGSCMADTGIHNANDLFTKQLLRTFHVRNSYSSLMSLTVI